MSYKAIYTYAWDLAEEGVGNAVDQFLKLGLDTVTIAGSYHAGKFLRPHGRSGKVYFPEDGTVYFHSDQTRYGAIKPVANAMLKERDILRELVDARRMAVNVWLVLLHNTRLGSAHPEAAVTNAFGDKYIYNLCPSAPASRAYALGLAKDVTESYGVSGISLETPGFLPYAHGYHHEFALNASNRWLDAMLGLCFCDHCVKGAEKAGIDAARLKAEVALDVRDYLASDVDFSADMADSFWHADGVCDDGFGRFLRWRMDVVTSLVAEIRAGVRRDADVAIIPSVARPTGGAWYEGSDLKGQAEAAGIIEACFYEPGAARVKADLFDVTRRLRGKGRLRGILRPAFPDFTAEAEFLGAVDALAAGGVRELAFYNWGHLRQSNVDRIGKAMKILDQYI